jgi:Ca-activated chloride channel family protein
MTYRDTAIVWPQFTYPLVLFGLLVPALLLAWVWANRWLLPSRRVVLPLDRARARGGWWWWTVITLAESIPPLLLAAGVCILAGPQRNGPPQQKRSLTNIQFCLDISGSMTAPYGEGTRYDGATAAIDKFLDYRKGDAFGLTFFGDSFVHWCPLTSDPSAVRCSFPFMRPEIAPPAFGGTAIAKALTGCKKELIQREEGDRMILLVTDGISYDLVGNDGDLTRELKDANITLFCVIAANFEPQAEIVNICKATGGEAFRADDPEALSTVFKKIDTMKQAKVSPTMVDTVDYYEPFVIVAAVLLILGALALFGLRYTPW